MRVFVYPPTAVSVSVPPVAYTDGGVSTPVTPITPLPVYETAIPLAKADLNFADTNVDDSAWVELITDTGSEKSEKIHIFMSSGEPLEFAFGASGSEVSKGYIFPGGNGFQDLTIPANTRVSIKAVNNVTISSGRLLVNFLG